MSKCGGDQTAIGARPSVRGPGDERILTPPSMVYGCLLPSDPEALIGCVTTTTTGLLTVSGDAPAFMMSPGRDNGDARRYSTGDVHLAGQGGCNGPTAVRGLKT